jgi:hypothetical protein
VTTVAPPGSSIALTIVGMLGFFVGSAFLFRATFFAPACLDLALAAKDFLGFDLATVRFAAFPRADLEVLRALPRAADFPVRAVARFFL